jgi:hypothetical protein
MKRLSILSAFTAVLLLGGGCSTAPSPATTETTTAIAPTPSDAVSPLGLSSNAAVTLTVGNALETDANLHPLMLGVISGPQNSNGGDVTAQYHTIGVTSVRNNDYYDDRLDMEQIFNCGGDTYPSWEGCDAADPENYHWTASDAQYQHYIDGGFTPFLRLGGEWQNANPTHDFKGPQNSTQEANWIAAALATTDRYEHWDNQPSAFTYLDLWTEFPGPHFWDRSNSEFADFFVSAYSAIKTAHPELKVGGPGFSALVSSQISQGKTGMASELLTKLYKKGAHLDWLGWHTFSSDPATYATESKAWQSLLDGTYAFANMPWSGTGFFKDTEVIVDAYGNGDSTRDGNVSSTTTAGAARLTGSWIALQQADIQGAFYYRGNEAGDGSKSAKKGKTETDGLGLITSAGGYTPSAYAFRLWSLITSIAPTVLTTDLSSNNPISDLSVLAGQGENGTVVILITNYGTEATTITPKIQGKILSDYGSATIAVVNDTNNGFTTERLTGSAVSVPANTIELITLTP